MFQAKTKQGHWRKPQLFCDQNSEVNVGGGGTRL